MKVWRYEIKQKYGFDVLSSNIPVNALWTTHCSKTKSGKSQAIPKEFYVSARNILFYHLMEENKLPYGILSDRYGIHFFDEKLDYYDVHPSQLTLKRKAQLGYVIRTKCLKRNFSTIIYWNPSPIFAKPYFEMLKFSGLTIYYTTSIQKLLA